MTQRSSSHVEPGERYVTLEELFQIQASSIGHEAHRLWTDLIHNRLHWHGWTSWLDGYTHADVHKLAEQFLNRHSHLKVGQENVYTQLPSVTFFFARQIHPTLYVRGAIWSNGAVWEEIQEERGRNLTLMMNSFTMKTFEYPDPNYDDDERLIDFRAYMGI